MANGDIVKKAKNMLIKSIGRISGYSKQVEVAAKSANIQINCSSHKLLTDDINEQVDSRIIAFFIPEDQWNGDNYGFDTITNLNNVVGKYYHSDNKRLAFYEGFKVGNIFRANNGLPYDMGDNVLLGIEYNVTAIKGPPHGIFTQYTVPWLSLMRDNIANLRIDIFVNEPADSLKFDANDNFEISPSEFNAATGGRYDLTIKCLKEFSTDQKLIIRSYKKNSFTNADEINIAGKLNVWSNEEVIHPNIVLVRVNVDQNSGTVTEDEKAMLRKTLNQACVVVTDIKVEILDIRNWQDFRNRFVRQDNGVNKLVIESDMTLNEALVTLTASNRIPAPGVRRYYMEAELNRAMAIVLPQYNNYLRIYCFDIDSAMPKHEAHYNLRRHAIVLYKTRRVYAMAHEVFHSLGLEHTFDNPGYSGSKNSLFTYQYLSTTNIMDYTGGFHTYHWQWVAIRRKNLRTRAAQVPPPIITLPAVPLIPTIPVVPSVPAHP